VLLFGVPAFLASIVISLTMFGIAAGAVWLFVLGDKPWPSSASNMLAALFFVVCATLWVVLMLVAYNFGKKQEQLEAFNARHVATSLGVTALLVLIVLSHQWRVGNIGTKSYGVLCSKFCQDKGFAASAMPPSETGAEICNCFDAQGREAARVPISAITGPQSK